VASFYIIVRSHSTLNGEKYAEDAQALVEDPWAKADELASSIGLGSKTHFFSTTIFGILSFST
jgi:hypothetical protein